MTAIDRATEPTHDPIYTAYRPFSALAGPLLQPLATTARIRTRHRLSPRERVVLSTLILTGAGSSIGTIVWLVTAVRLPPLQLAWHPLLPLIGFSLLILLESVRAIQAATVWLWAWNMKDPVPLRPPSGLRVALLTTIVPSREPLAIVERTLRAMTRVRYAQGSVDVWILDEENDARVRALARELGINHFTRHGRPEYNQSSGPFRARTKAGNHNAWAAEHGARYDVVGQVDADHVPYPDFLERTLGYFRDPDVAFVVAPQVYGNREHSFVAHGAAEMAYLFDGVVQRAGNAWGAPILIGTNHLYRVAAWQQIGGYQPSIIEDHLTSLTIHTTRNPRTGRWWKGVYTPDILSVGEGPSTWADFFNQQFRWAYGMWEVILRFDRALLTRLNPARLLHYVALQSFYPGLAAVWSLASLLTVFYLALGVTYRFPATYWLMWTGVFAVRLALFFWLRRFNLTPIEQRSLGLRGMALSTFTIPIYFAAAAAALLRRPLTYVVTRKGVVEAGESLSTFRYHLAWIGVILALVALSWPLGNTNDWIRFWAYLSLGILVVPLLLAGLWRQKVVRVLIALVLVLCTAGMVNLALVLGAH